MIKVLKSKIRELILVVVILILWIITGMITPNFFTFDNIASIFNNYSIKGIMAIGMMLVIVTGNIDVSVGAQFASLCVIAAIFARATNSQYTLLTFIVTMIGGAALGLINGLFVARLRIPAIVVTLGTLNILRGILMYLTNGEPITNLRGNYTVFSRIKVFENISIFSLIWILVMVLIYIFLYRMRTGRRVMAVGGNPSAAERIGINPQKYYVLVFVIMGVLVGLAAAMQVSRLAFGHPISGNGYEMTLIAAAVIGGTVFTGGVASILGTFLGAVLLATVENALVFAKISAYLQSLITGIILIIAVVSSAMRLSTKTRAKVPE